MPHLPASDLNYNQHNFPWFAVVNYSLTIAAFKSACARSSLLWQSGTMFLDS